MKNNTEPKLAVVTGADGGMGTEITRALAFAGYRVVMACCRVQKAEEVRRNLLRERSGLQMEIRKIDLASFASVAAFADGMLAEGKRVSLLMNNAGTMETARRITEDGLERTVSVNYAGHYLLTRKLLPLMGEGSRIVNTVSCTYAIGKIDADFFEKGRSGRFYRIPVYSNTKLALLLFTQELAGRLRDKGITVNASDPGIVSTDMIRMHAWFDPLTDIFYRPFIKTPAQGAATAIYLALDEPVGAKTGCCFANCKEKHLPERILHHAQQQTLWNDTEKLLQERISRLSNVR